MEKNEGLSIVLPAYNEEKNIKRVVSGITASVGSYTGTFELIVVNDGSTDKTKEIITTLSAGCPFLRLIDVKRNEGYGAAIRRGIYGAKMPWLLIMDADGQYEIGDLGNFWQRKSGYDFIIGYRKKRSDNLYRILLGRLGNLIANLFLRSGIFIKDIDCGFKLFKTADLKAAPIVSSGAIISFEIVRKLLQDKRIFTQAPVNHYRRSAGSATGGKFKSIKQIIAEFLKLIFIRTVDEGHKNSCL